MIKVFPIQTDFRTGTNHHRCFYSAVISFFYPFSIILPSFPFPPSPIFSYLLLSSPIYFYFDSFPYLDYLSDFQS